MGFSFLKHFSNCFFGYRRLTGSMAVRKQSEGSEVARKEWVMPHYIRTGLEIVGNRFCGVRNPTFRREVWLSPPSIKHDGDCVISATRPSTPWKRCGSFEALSYGIWLFWGGSWQESTSIQIRMLRMYIRKTGEIFLKTTKRNNWRGFRFRLWRSLKVDTPIINVQVC